MVNLFVRTKFLDWFFLSIASFLGLLLSYLVFVSDLPVTDWNWLLVPFNLLPLVFWKWRRRWALYFAIMLAVWELGMMIYPHRLTDPAYLVLVLAYAIFWLKFTRIAEPLRKEKL